MLSWIKRRLSTRSGRDAAEISPAQTAPGGSDAAAGASGAPLDTIQQTKPDKISPQTSITKTTKPSKTAQPTKGASKASGTDSKSATRSSRRADKTSSKSKKESKSSKSSKAKPVVVESDDDKPEQQCAASLPHDRKRRHSHHHNIHQSDYSDYENTDDEVQCEPEGANEEEGDEAFIGDVDFELDDNIADALDRGDFSCLSPEDILREQNRRIKEVAELMNVSDAVAGNLLRHYKWRQEQLITRYFENPKAVLKELGAAPAAPNPLAGSKNKHDTHSHKKHSVTDGTAHLEGEVECLICADEYPASDCTALQTCKHAFCNDCWRSYLTMKINEGKVQVITCPARDCVGFVPESVVQHIVDEDVFNKYVRFVTKSFVEDNAQCTWCPAPGCGNAITGDMVVSTSCSSTVQCSCGFRFCFHCKNEAHQPASCDQVREWQKKCLDDSETLHWVGANTKDCPRCHVSVEKNGGCMHMTCPRCTYEWCWLCLRPWKGHNDYYSCNRYDKAQQKKQKESSSSKKKKFQRLEEEREKQRLALERYLHYFERYRGHDTASKMEKHIKDKAYQKMAALQLDSSTRAETQFIEKGTNTLLQCHNVLKYSYVFSYNLPEDSAEKHLFHFLQQELEKTTEQLAEILEAPGVLMKRTEAVDLTRLAQTMKDNLIKGVEMGLSSS